MLDQLLDLSPYVSIDTLILLPVLVALEAVLSADNAIALAAIAQGLPSEEMQRKSLNAGLVIAFVLRVLLIVSATWVLKFWPFEVAGALYLLWLVYQYFSSSKDGDGDHHGPRFASLWQAIPVIAFTDLAFSLDSVTTAIALSDDIWLIILGGLIGILALRFMAGLFIRWLDVFTHLEDAGFITVGLVGMRLLVRVINPGWVPPDWALVASITAIFVWGFSQRNPETEAGEGSDEAEESTVAALDATADATADAAHHAPLTGVGAGSAESAEEESEPSSVGPS